MTENLSKVPSRGILKQSTSFEQRELDPSHPPRNPHFDEQNLLETLHPADKDYGFMKIDEPKTPYEYADDSSSSGGGAGGGAGGGIQEESEEEDEEGASGTRPGANSAARKPEELDAQLLSERIQAEAEKRPRRFSEPGTEEDLKTMSPEDRERRKSFESKRKAHYNEFYAVKMARQLMAEADDDEEDEEEKEEDSKADAAADKTASKEEDSSMEMV